jgi:hypothetical protein
MRDVDGDGESRGWPEGPPTPEQREWLHQHLERAAAEGLFERVGVREDGQIVYRRPPELSDEEWLAAWKEFSDRERRKDA